MRALLLLICCSAACRIPGDHFIGPGGGDDAGGDGDGSGSDAAIVVASKGWIVADGSTANAGLIRVAKDPSTGELSNVPGTFTAVSHAKSAVTNKASTHLFVAQDNPTTTSAILDFAIAADGALTLSETRPLPCAPKYLALHPNGNYLAVGCAAGAMSLLTITLANGGTINANSPIMSVVGSPTPNVAFSPDGMCLFATDPSTAAGDPVHPYLVNPGTGGAVAMPTEVGPAGSSGIAITPNGLFAYVSGFSFVNMYLLDPTSCNLSQMQILGTTPISNSITHALVNPAGTRMFATSGNSVWAYDINPNNGMLMSTTVPNSTIGANDLSAMVMDPAKPNVLYLTAAQGTVAATIAASGALTPGVTIPGSISPAVWFAFAP